MDSSSIGTLYTGMSSTVSWTGMVTISADLINLSPPERIRSCSGEAEFWGKWGMVAAGGCGAAVAIPYGFGKAVDRAIDQAARIALSELTAGAGR